VIFDTEGILAFEVLDEPPGVEIVDQLERLRYRFHTAGEVSPTPIGTGAFHFPVGSALSLTTESISLPTVVLVCIRDQAGQMLTEVGHLDEETVGAGSYILDLSTQIKTYFEVEGPIQVTSDVFETRIEFEEPQELRLGVRSPHERPAATVTTTADPVDMMAAVSAFGSALHSTTPERSYPSLRGHPPAIQVGDTLDVPDTVQPPDTGIRLEVPPNHSAVYTVAPLSYYLGAEVVPGSTPRLVTDSGFVHPLDAPHGLEHGVEQTLKQLFTLDCVTRTEGLYDVELHERTAIERAVDIDFGALYDRPLAEQVATYLDLPHAIVEEHVPQWRLTAHIEPVATSAELLPFVVDDLAVVRTATAGGSGTPATRPQTVDQLTREGALVRSSSETTGGAERSYVEPESTESLEQAWIGDGVPIGASKPTREAFQNRFDRERTDGDISITIVLNDSRMAEERDLVDRAYGDRENLPFDVSVFRDLTTAELREVLARESDFVHYIGHTDQDGFRCADGKLDAATLGSTGIDSFLLNACNSYEQGLHLIEAGAIGGIVTLNEVLNDGAVRIGETVARLLNAGFPLRAALTIARGESILGGQYIVVGDGGMTVTQSASRTPNLLEISRTGEEFELHVKTYATDEAGLGTIYIPHLRESEEYFLTSGETTNFHIPEDRLAEFLQLEDVPIRNNGELQWCSSIDVSDID
jgi:hypothetical protein